MEYRQIILDAAERHARPGDDWEAALLAGAPVRMVADDALAIADWLESEADSAWGADPRHALIAADIREQLDNKRDRAEK